MRSCLPVPLIVALVLSACGGANDETTQAAPKAALHAQHLAAETKQAPEAYTDLVTRLFLAYFGRPPDFRELPYWSMQYSNQNLPVAPDAFLNAYATNTAVRDAMELFFSGPQAQEMFTGSDQAFVHAVYRNVFSRDADIGGLEFWSGFLKNKQLTRAQLALWIGLGGQGDDAVAYNKKLQVAARVMANISNGNSAIQAAGLNYASTQELLAEVNATTDLSAYQSKIDHFTSTLASAGGPMPVFEYYYGFNYLQDVDQAPSYSAKYRYLSSSALITADAGSLSLGIVPRPVSWSRDLSTDVWNYGAPFSNSLGLVIAHARIGTNPRFVGYALPDIAMLCKPLNGEDKSTDVLVTRWATPVTKATELAGARLDVYRENCAVASQPQSLVFDADGNLTITTPAGTQNYSAATVDRLLAGLKLTDKFTTKLFTLRAYSLPKIGAGTTYVIVEQQAGVSVNLNNGTLGLWAQQ